MKIAAARFSPRATPHIAHILALGALTLALESCDSSDGDCGKPGAAACATTTTSVTTTSSSTSSTSMPSRAHACCLPNLECEHLGEQQCYRQGGGWEPGGSIECSIDLCQDPDEHPISYEIMLSVTNAETLGALQFDVDYGAVSGGFDGSGSTVLCTKLAGDFAAFNDHEAEETLAVAMISLSGITGPIDLAICTFVSRVPPDPGGFPVTIIDQSRPDLTPAAASVAVTDVRALNTTSTTTTTVSN